jgi:hypothetical protein
MIKKNVQFQMELMIHEVFKPYFIEADFEIDFAFDADLEPYIKSIDLIEAIIVDRYNDSWQFMLVPDKNNSLYLGIEKQIIQVIQGNQSEDLIQEFLIDVENEYFETVGAMQ